MKLGLPYYRTLMKLEWLIEVHLNMLSYYLIKSVEMAEWWTTRLRMCNTCCWCPTSVFWVFFLADDLWLDMIQLIKTTIDGESGYTTTHMHIYNILYIYISYLFIFAFFIFYLYYSHIYIYIVFLFIYLLIRLLYFLYIHITWHNTTRKNWPHILILHGHCDVTAMVPGLVNIHSLLL